MTAFAIRPAVEADVPALCALFADYHAGLRQCGMPYTLHSAELPAVLSARIRSQLFYVGVADADGAVVGFVIASLLRVSSEYADEGQRHTGYINEIYVAPALRGQNCSGALLACAHRWLREGGAATVESHVLTANPAGAGLFRASGYEAVATILNKKL